MARVYLLLGFTLGVVVTMLTGAALGSHAADPEASEQVKHAAADAGVDPVDLQGAVNTLHVDPVVYLRAEGLLEHAPGPPPALKPQPLPPLRDSSRVACIIRVESHGDPNARNRSGASGLGQFLPSTWATTPQGRAGLSVWDPAANRAAIDWMISAGRAREFVAVTAYGC